MKTRIAVLDDEVRMVEIISMVLKREGYEVSGFSDGAEALQSLKSDPVDLLVCDLRMPAPDGLEVLRRALELDSSLPVILITAHGTISSAIEAIELGAFDYVEKPFDNTELKAVVRRALDMTRLSRENRYLRAALRSKYSLDRIVAASAQMRAVLDLTRRAARGRSTVLISGESGTGKELIARAVHYHSERVAAPFVAVNCKSFSEGVLESELFGHEKGAFTGAQRSRTGVFEQARGGTLFLDEIGEIDLDFQAKLLRVLQERVIRPVGSDVQKQIDVRIVVASNRDLQQEVAAGNFREDLYFRLAVIPIHLPPLRDRIDDILPMARHFLSEYAADHPVAVREWSPEVEAYLLQYRWPGNARELENTIERGVVLARGDRLEFDDLLVDELTTEGEVPPQSGQALRDFLDHAAAKCITQALREAGGKRAEAARRLGVERTTLYRLMRKLSIEG